MWMVIEKYLQANRALSRPARTGRPPSARLEQDPQRISFVTPGLFRFGFQRGLVGLGAGQLFDLVGELGRFHRSSVVVVGRGLLAHLPRIRGAVPRDPRSPRSGDLRRTQNLCAYHERQVPPAEAQRLAQLVSFRANTSS